MTAREAPGATAKDRLSDREDTRWDLDRRVPIALIMALLVQGAGLVWYGAKLDQRVASLEQRNGVQERAVAADRAFHTEQRVRLWDRINIMQQDQSALRTDLARMQARIESIDKNLERLIGLILDRRSRTGSSDPERN